MITIYENIFSKTPHYKTIEHALGRIRNGSSKDKILALRAQSHTATANTLKAQLPSVCFSGTFTERKDDALVEHSGFIVLDFDKVFNPPAYKEIIAQDKYTYATWISPSGNGVKALVRIADPSKHKEHFQSLLEYYPDLDKSGINVSRVCYESYDPEIYINTEADVYTTIKSFKLEDVRVENNYSDNDIFLNLIKWMDNKGDVFMTGQRNIYIFKLAGACCRYGMPQAVAEAEVRNYFNYGNDFSVKEAMQAVRSGYKKNITDFGTAKFENERLMTTATNTEVPISIADDETSDRIGEILYANDVLDKIYDVYKNGYPKLNGVNTPELDELFKLMEGEITLLSGFANYGKSTFLMWYLTMRSLMYDDKWCLYVPESGRERFYIDIASIYVGHYIPRSGTVLDGHGNPIVDEQLMFEATRWINEHFYIVHLKDAMPTPQNILAVFLKTIIKHKVNGCIVDPFNQMDNDYGKHGGRSDKYLEATLSLFSRFTIDNNIFFIIVAHPTKTQKGPDGNFPCPEYYDIADGAMWANKMDNILIYHRPFRQTVPNDPTCELHSKKIRKQHTVGKLGYVSFQHNWKTHRYVYEQGTQFIDPMQQVIDSLG